MKRTDALYQSFVEILREELVPAMGCTEPIAIAYAAAQARAVLGKRLIPASPPVSSCFFSIFFQFLILMT